MGIGNILKDLVNDIIHPLNTSRCLAYTPILILFGVIIKIFHRKFLAVLQNKTVWAVLAMCFCVYAASGQTWNQIRKPKMFNVEKDGGIGYFSNKYKFQYHMESHIIAATYAGVIIGLILIIEAEGGVNKRRQRQTRWSQVLSVLGLILVCLCFSMLLDYLRKKRWHVCGIFLLHIP